MGIDKIDGSKIPEEPVKGMEGEEEVLDKQSPSRFDKILEKREKGREDERNDRVREKGNKKDGNEGVKEKKRLKKEDPNEFLKMASLKMRTFEKGSMQVENKKGISIDTKVLVDEIVSKMRVGVNRSGSAEVQIDLKSTVLEGLKITISITKEGIVTSFEAANLRVLDGLREHMDDLISGLKEKGVNVSDVKLFLKEEREKERKENWERRNRQNRWK